MVEGCGCWEGECVTIVRVGVHIFTSHPYPDFIHISFPSTIRDISTMILTQSFTLPHCILYSTPHLTSSKSHNHDNALTATWTCSNQSIPNATRHAIPSRSFQNLQRYAFMLFIVQVITTVYGTCML